MAVEETSKQARIECQSSLLSLLPCSRAKNPRRLLGSAPVSPRAQVLQWRQTPFEWALPADIRLLGVRIRACSPHPFPHGSHALCVLTTTAH